MPTITYPEPPPPFSCSICRTPDHVNKLGTEVCRACPSFKDKHFFPRPIGDLNCDVLFIGDVPLVPRLTVLKFNRDPEHITFSDTAGKVVVSAVSQLKKDERYYLIRCRYTYAVKCAVDNATKKTIQACRTSLYAELQSIAKARQEAGNLLPLVVVAHGVTTLRSLGITVQSEKETMGMTYSVHIGNIPIQVVASRGMKSIVGAPGKYSSLVADVDRAFRIAINKPVIRIEREVLETNYVYPKTVEEVKAICDEVIAAAAPGQAPEEWAISIDTETNTLFPHRDGLQLTIVSMAWGPGKACAIPLWHKDTPYDPALAWEHVKRVLYSQKKKIFHNYKYDIKVFWKMGVDVERFHWDVMLAEHALEEDKKGQYGLKYLVKQFLPEYAGYEDQLHEKLVTAEGGERQLDNIKKAKKAGLEIVEVPVVAKQAFDTLNLKQPFKISTLKEQVAKLKEKISVGRLPVHDVVDRLGIPYPVDTHSEHLLVFKRTVKVLRMSETLLAETLSPKDNQIISDVSFITNVLETDKIINEPPTEKDNEYITNAEIVLAYESYFKDSDKVFITKQEAKSGGFENIPLWEVDSEKNINYKKGVQLFYAAVDADVTRQLGILQSKRMSVEDARYKNLKNEVKRLIEMQRKYTSETFEVQDRCTIQNPIANLVKSYYVPRARELASIEYRGVKVNHEYIKKSTIKLEGLVREETEKLFKMAGTEFKVGDGRKIARYLFDTGEGYVPSNPDKAQALAEKYPKRVKFSNGKLMYKGISYTEKGALQTTEKVLRTLSNTYDCEFANTILLLRKALKAKDTFLSNALNLSALDYFLHTSYNLNGTATGRLSSSDINMQNIPKGEMGGIPKDDPRYSLFTKEQRAGISCKRMFIPDDLEEELFVNIDAKGAEVSVFAAYSMDPMLIAALRDGMDSHSFFSSKILDPNKVAEGLSGEDRKLALKKVDIDDDHAWTYDDFFGRDAYADSTDPALQAYAKRLKKHRDNIKRVVFGILFGAGHRKIAEIVGIEETLARSIIDLLFKMFPTIPAFIEQTKWELRTFGMVETYFGRKRRFAIQNAPKEMIARAERQGVNFDIQSTNSEIILWCLTQMSPVIEREFGGRIVLTVHDSIGFLIKKRYVTQLKDFVKEYGTKRVAQLCPWFPVEFKWDIEVGSSYGDLMSLDRYLLNHKEELEALNQPLVEEEILQDLRLEGEGELS